MRSHRHLEPDDFRLRGLLSSKTSLHLLLSELSLLRNDLSPAIKVCLRHLDRHDPRSSDPFPQEATPILEALVARMSATERATAYRSGRQDFLLLSRIPEPGARLEKIQRAYRRFTSPALVALLLGRAREIIQSDPSQALHWARLAEEVAARSPLGRRRHPTAATTPGCRALAVAYQANALRAAGELGKAEALFTAAGDEIGTALHPWLQGELWSLRGSLLKDQRRLSDAQQSLANARKSYLAASDSVSATQADLNLAAVLRLAGKLEDAIRLLRRSVAYLDPGTAPRLHLWAHHNLAVYLLRSGRPGNRPAALVAAAATLRAVPRPPSTVATAMARRHSGARSRGASIG